MNTTNSNNYKDWLKLQIDHNGGEDLRGGVKHQHHSAPLLPSER